MAVIILSMDVSAGYRKIRRALNSVGGVESVEVYPDTGCVVVTGWANGVEVVTALETKLRVTVSIVNRQEPKLEFPSDEEDDSDDNESSLGDEYYYQKGQPANFEHWAPWNPSPDAEWHGMGLPAIPTREPWMADEPVPDPSSLFYNFNLGDNSQLEDDNDE